jgi:hypothetical protein
MGSVKITECTLLTHGRTQQELSHMTGQEHSAAIFPRNPSAKTGYLFHMGKLEYAHRYSKYSEGALLVALASGGWSPKDLYSLTITQGKTLSHVPK